MSGKKGMVIGKRPCPICHRQMRASARMCELCYATGRSKSAPIKGVRAGSKQGNGYSPPPPYTDGRPLFAWITGRGSGPPVVGPPWRAGSLVELQEGLVAHPRPAGLASLWLLEPEAWCLLASPADAVGLVGFLWALVKGRGGECRV